VVTGACVRMQTPDALHGVTILEGDEFPEAHNSWFPPFRWTPAMCAQCSRSLGWLFTPPEARKEVAPFLR
jgi:hypothetical protein